MGTENIMKEWIKSANEDFEAVEILFTGKKYAQSLFFGHLTLEKLLKALYAKTYPSQPHAPNIKYITEAKEWLKEKLV